MNCSVIVIRHASRNMARSTSLVDLQDNMYVMTLGMDNTHLCFVRTAWPECRSDHECRGQVTVDTWQLLSALPDSVHCAMAVT